MALSRSIARAAAVAVAVLTPLAAMAPVQGAARIAQPPSPDELISVSCPAPSVCLAVGDRDFGRRGALAERWNGKRWRVLATPALTGSQGSSKLVAVSCQSTSLCIALGWRSRTDAGNQAGVVEEWNGVRWRLLDVRFPRTWGLRDVSCVRRGCMIVGVVPGSRGLSFPLAARLTGTRLRRLKPAVPKGSVGGFLQGVSCTGDSFCAAVGGYNVFEVGTVNLAETWNGRAWRIRRTWHPGGLDTLLDAVACASPGLCMAGGAPVASLRGGMPINLLWKSGRWRTLKADRQLAGPPDVPTGVSCPTVARCVATEYGLNSSHSAALIWNGGRTLSVHLVRQPAIGALYSISCPRPRPIRCVAVGGLAQGAGTRNGVFAELWNGRRWFLTS